MRKGSVLLLALFLILFVSTAIAIIYSTNKRYTLILKEQRENPSNLTKYQKDNFNLYIVNSFIKNKGSLNTIYSLDKIYNNSIESYELCKINDPNIANKLIYSIYYTIIDGLIYSNIYNNQSFRKFSLFHKPIMNLYTYDLSRGLIYMPDNIRNIFYQKMLSNRERNFLEQYKRIIISYIEDTFSVSRGNLGIVFKYNYSDQEIIANRIYQTSKRKINIDLKFRVGNNIYLLTSDFFIKNQIESLKINNIQNSSDNSLSFV